MRGLLVFTCARPSGNARMERAFDDLERDGERRDLTTLWLPLLETEPGADHERFQKWLGQAQPGAAIAWTSKRAAEALSGIALPNQADALARVPLYAVGPGSAAPIREAGLTVEVPDVVEGAAALATWLLSQRGGRGIERVAFLHGDKALPTLPEILRSAGVPVEPFELYRTRFVSPDTAPLQAALAAGTLVAVGFGSPSEVEAFERLLPPDSLAALRESVKVLPMGDTTHNALVARGYKRPRTPMRRGTIELMWREAMMTREEPE